MLCLAERAALSISVPIRRQLKDPFFRYLVSGYALVGMPVDCSQSLVKKLLRDSYGSNVCGRFHFDVEEAQRRKGLRPLREPGDRIA